LVKRSGQPQSHLTWACIFVNSNYRAFLDEFLPLFREQRVILVAHSKADPGRLPFHVHSFFGVGRNAWLSDYALADQLAARMRDGEYPGGCIFLIAAGPFANILVHKLHCTNPRNTYIDIGSTLDVLLGLGATRRYLRNPKTALRVCIWEKEFVPAGGPGRPGQCRAESGRRDREPLPTVQVRRP
jgi:hypothetical protein